MLLEPNGLSERPDAMPPLLLVMAGGALGAGARYTVGGWVLRALGPGYPYGTLAINLIGGLLMGALAGILARIGGGEPWRLFVGVGILGGFTTFSSFSLETHLMIARGDFLVACGYALASVVGSVLMLMLGLYAVRAMA